MAFPRLDVDLPQTLPLRIEFPPSRKSPSGILTKTHETTTLGPNVPFADTTPLPAHPEKARGRRISKHVEGPPYSQNGQSPGTDPRPMWASSPPGCGAGRRSRRWSERGEDSLGSIEHGVSVRVFALGWEDSRTKTRKYFKNFFSVTPFEKRPSSLFRRLARLPFPDHAREALQGTADGRVSGW